LKYGTTLAVIPVMGKKRVRIRDLYATLEHNFPFAVGDEVTINANGETATVEDAVWEGKAPAGSYTLTYHVTRENGENLEIGLTELLKFNEAP
jgi:hypothetical protein